MSLSDPLPRPASTLRRDAWDGNHEVERDPPGNSRALDRGDIAMGEGGLPLPGQNETQKSLSGNPLPRPGAGAVMAISGGKPYQGVSLTPVSRRGESQNPVFQACPGTLDRGDIATGGRGPGRGSSPGKMIPGRSSLQAPPPSPQVGTRKSLSGTPTPPPLRAPPPPPRGRGQCVAIPSGKPCQIPDLTPVSRDKGSVGPNPVLPRDPHVLDRGSIHHREDRERPWMRPSEGSEIRPVFLPVRLRGIENCCNRYGDAASRVAGKKGVEEGEEGIPRETAMGLRPGLPVSRGNPLPRLRASPWCSARRRPLPGRSPRPPGAPGRTL